MKRYIKYKQGQFVYDFEFLDINIFNRDSVVERELSLAIVAFLTKFALPHLQEFLQTKCLHPKSGKTNSLKSIRIGYRCKHHTQCLLKMLAALLILKVAMPATALRKVEILERVKKYKEVYLGAICLYQERRRY